MWNVFLHYHVYAFYYRAASDNASGQMSPSYCPLHVTQAAGNANSLILSIFRMCLTCQFFKKCRPGSITGKFLSKMIASSYKLTIVIVPRTRNDIYCLCNYWCFFLVQQLRRMRLITCIGVLHRRVLGNLCLRRMGWYPTEKRYRISYRLIGADGCQPRDRKDFESSWFWTWVPRLGNIRIKIFCREKRK